MNTSKMWYEIQEQDQVMEKVISYYVDKLDSYASHLISAKKVVLAGTGASLNVCKSAQYFFGYLNGLTPHVFEAADLLAQEIDLNAGDIVILVSQSGESFETKQLCEKLTRRGVMLWGVTNNPNSYLAKKSDVVLDVLAGEEVSSATKSYSASLLLLALIACSQNLGRRKTIMRLPSLIRESFNKVEGRIALMAEALANSQNLFITGLGLNGPVAMQASLLIKEKGFIHADGMSIAELRHGTIEVVTQGTKVILTGAGQQYIEAAKVHGERLLEIGADVFFVGDRKLNIQGLSEEKQIVTAQSPYEILFPFLGAIPFQLLAEKIACIKGYDVDGFRYISKVVGGY